MSRLATLNILIFMALLMVPVVNAHSAIWQEPQDSGLAKNKPDEYAWCLFVALNWPADQAKRQADSRKAFGTEGPVVWEVWKNANDVYLPRGADPGDWQTPDSHEDSDTMTASRFSALTPVQKINARHIVNGVMVPTTDFPTATQPLREMRMNRITFDYIHTNQLYSVEGQLLRYGEKTPVIFPLGAKEIKAEWLPIDNKLQSRYHTLTLKLPDGSTQLYGLSALHILSKDLPTWFWATFEHVDNPSRSDSEPWLLNSVDSFSCGKRQLNCNRVPQGLGLENTVWQHYRLRGTQTSFVNVDGEPTLLANSRLEAGTQQHSSCMTCHARASISLQNRRAVRLEPFNTKVAPDTPGVRQTYVGKPQVSWFYSNTEAGTQQVFMPLDFVWSLSKAQSTAVSISQ